jgi:hypothetical protein
VVGLRNPAAKKESVFIFQIFHQPKKQWAKEVSVSSHCATRQFPIIHQWRHCVKQKKGAG